MKIYRVEMPDGNGPYSFNSPFDPKVAMGLVHGSDKVNHPSIKRDFDDGDKDLQEDCLAYFCGFNSMNKLDKWFDGFKTLLNKEGAKITIYSCPSRYVKMGKSGTQLVFRKDKAKLLKTLSL